MSARRLHHLPHLSRGTHMNANVHVDEDQLVAGFIQRMSSCSGDDQAARIAFRESFNRIRSQVAMYPSSGVRPSAVFESAATTVRYLGAACLPLGIAVAMHLYPLCALQCVPLPMLSTARFQRALLLRTIRHRSLILANTGSDRARGASVPVAATGTADGVRIDGTYEYMSLASVADIVLFKAPFENSNSAVLCAADLRADSVRIGSWKFGDSMRLSDTCSVTFTRHYVPHGRFLLVPNDRSSRCISDYQRCWFHLFIAELYLARLERLHHLWGLTRCAEAVVSLNELARLKEYSLRLLDDFSARAEIEPLKKTTSAMKLRVSLIAQSMIATLLSLERPAGADVRQLRADAGELRYIKSQPTSDETILRDLCAEQSRLS